LVSVTEEDALPFPLTSPPDDLFVTPVGWFGRAERGGSGGKKRSEGFHHLFGAIPKGFPRFHVIFIGSVTPHTRFIFNIEKISYTSSPGNQFFYE